MNFVNPPPDDGNRDYSDNLVYPLGQEVDVKWTPSEVESPTSVVMWQVNLTTGKWIGDFEHVTRRTVNIREWEWFVGTGKDLDVSNVFFLSLYEDEKSVSTANSRYFNITKVEEDFNVTTTSTPTPTSMSTSTTVPEPTTSADNNPKKDEIEDADGSSDGLSTAAYVGIAVAIACVFAILAFLFWCWFRRRRNTRNPSQQQDYMGNPGDEKWSDSAHTRELGQQCYPAELADKVHGPPKVYELPAARFSRAELPS
ncbi:uncharacterized protein F5Z01DRAFT_656778 [Emericellopsis atlantica]|uniref:Mid2 domain-containing protein n=1 Tax=Emericellopsis atlantica TaxID=2614577 RepID=A0A9P8CP68_9HYPO|nr:uncharacterized protein F5Z01DRAFT_656778 [Emericellopsis atlantica]KAG9253815.1 hypothetical protein F5Z01DRAFT_656778 [Emericellopsis atlantica]